MPRQMIENERATAVIPGEAIEEKVSLSDRFGLWLGFHPCNQETYLAMVERYADRFGLEVEAETLQARGPGVVQDPRQPLGPGGVAVHPGPGGAAGKAGRHGRAGGVGHRPQGAVSNRTRHRLAVETPSSRAGVASAVSVATTKPKPDGRLSPPYAIRVNAGTKKCSYAPTSGKWNPSHPEE